MNILSTTPDHTPFHQCPHVLGWIHVRRARRLEEDFRAAILQKGMLSWLAPVCCGVIQLETPISSEAEGTISATNCVENVRAFHVGANAKNPTDPNIETALSI